MANQDYQQKFEKIINQTNFQYLPNHIQEFLKEKAFLHRFTMQEFRQIVEIAIDFNMWNENSIIDVWSEDAKHKKVLISMIHTAWQDLKDSAKSYDSLKNIKIKPQKISFIEHEKEVGFGVCPVASPKTRCCNLLTLDSVESCGFDCSYCSIQSFYNENKIVFNTSFEEKLKNIKIDPNEIYHIGTGQSSDSLMWGNRNGMLDTLVHFAKKHPNVILEMKTKSKNIDYFLQNDIPSNIICTWSLNPQTIIDHEEHLTASLDERVKAAKKAADKGILVGFHFHPMVYYKGWREEYGEIFQRLLKDFKPEQVAMVSLGTLTFIKPVIKKIRQRDFKTKILQMPFVDSDGKSSYPKEIKTEMFKFACNSLKPWHKKVFFYMCMENHSLWKEVFGYEYPTNESFEMDMKLSYKTKINHIRERIEPPSH